MPRTVAELMKANLFEVFGERDEAKRAAVAAEIFAEDVRFADPEDVVVGREAVIAKAKGLLDGAPGFVFAAAGEVRQAQDLGYLAWSFGPEGGPAVATGTDIGLVADGRISALYTLLG